MYIRIASDTSPPVNPLGYLFGWARSCSPSLVQHHFLYTQYLSDVVGHTSVPPVLFAISSSELDPALLQSITSNTRSISCLSCVALRLSGDRLTALSALVFLSVSVPCFACFALGSLCVSPLGPIVVLRYRPLFLISCSSSGRPVQDKGILTHFSTCGG